MTVHLVETAQGARAGHLRLPPGAPLAEGLAAAFMDIVSYARAQARHSEASPVEAVHEYRKAVRRTRAMLRLCRDLLDADVHAELATTLGDIHRATSRLRDRHVVPGTLKGLALTGELADLAASVDSRIAAAAPMNPEAVVATLRAGAERLEPLPELLGDALPDTVQWSQIRDGVRASYARARQGMHDTFHLGHDDAIHDWRKRTKELGYQIELLVSMVAIGHVRELRRRLSTLAHDLGRIIDLMVLEQYVREHATAEEQQQLGDHVARERTRVLTEALDRGQDLFDARPRQFARAIASATRRAHKLARRALKRAD